MPLDIKLDADPASIDAFAEWAGTQASRIEKATSAIASAKSGSASGWVDESGDHFRNAVETLHGHGTDLHKHYVSLQDAARTYAGDMRKVKAKFHQAADIARGAGLKVDNDRIEDPGPAPNKPQAIGSGPNSADVAYSPDNMKYMEWHRKAEAYAKATSIVLEGRSEESQGNTAAQNFVEKLVGNPPQIKAVTTLVSIASTSISGVQELEETADEFGSIAKSEMEEYGHLRGKGIPGTGASASRSWIKGALATSKERVASRELENAKIGQWFSRLPGWLKTGLTAKVLDFLPKDSAIVTKAPIWAKKIPVIGTLVTAGLTTWDIAEGGDPYRDIGSALAGIVGSGVAGAAVAGPWGIPAGLLVGAASSFGADELIGKIEEGVDKSFDPPSQVEAPGKPNLTGQPEPPSTKGTA